MDKKKKLVSHKDSEKKEAPRFVTQVVEIIEVDNANELSEEIEKEKKQKTPTEPETKSDLEEVSSESFEDIEDEEEVEEEKVIDLPHTHTTKQETDNIEDESEEETHEEIESPKIPVTKQKQVVEELFSNRDTAKVTEISIHKKSRKTPIALWAIIVIVVALITGLGMMAITSGFGGNLPGKTVTVPTPTTIVTPSPTPVPAPTKDTLKVQVLNGGGVPGAATKMRKALEDAGYTVTNVGNAEDYTFEETEVQVKSGSTSTQEMVEKDLSGTYTIASQSTPLTDDSAYDVVVIVGKN